MQDLFERKMVMIRIMCISFVVIQSFLSET